MTGLAIHLTALFAAASLATSLLVGVGGRVARARIASLEPASRARLTLAALAAPPFVGALVVGRSASSCSACWLSSASGSSWARR